MSAEDKIHLLNAAETYKVIALSTAHISKEDAAALDAAAADPEENMVMKRSTGWFIKLYWEQDSNDQETKNRNRRHGVSAEIKDLLSMAANAGFQMVEFDSDADCVAGIPIFDWEDDSPELTVLTKQTLTTFEAGANYIDALIKTGFFYHFDDDPADALRHFNLGPEQIEALKHNVDQLFGIDWKTGGFDGPFHYASAK